MVARRETQTRTFTPIAATTSYTPQATQLTTYTMADKDKMAKYRTEIQQVSGFSCALTSFVRLCSFASVSTPSSIPHTHVMQACVVPFRGHRHLKLIFRAVKLSAFSPLWLAQPSIHICFCLLQFIVYIGSQPAYIRPLQRTCYFSICMAGMQSTIIEPF